MEPVDVAIPLETGPAWPLVGAALGASPNDVDTPQAALAEALRSLDRADVPTARGLAQSVLLGAKATGDPLSEAQALACLAHCDRVAQRPRRAADTSRRAAQIFQRIGDAAGESAALNTLSFATMLLGRTDEALEAGLLSVRLAEINGATPSAVLAFSCLGMSYCWSGIFDKAAAALDSAILLAARCEPEMSSYQPKLNLLFVEAMRLADARYQTNALPSTKRMSSLIRECRRLERSGADLRFMPGMMPMAQTISLVMKLLWAAWLGDEENARIYAGRAVGSLGGTVTWLDALVHWGLAEVAWMRGNWDAAEASLKEMRACAAAVEHEKLACHAHLLLIQVYELQGKAGMAMLEGRALRSREHRMARESISSREAVVNWQLGARQSERHLEQALEASRQFERWSLEDALTGIANRRAFEMALADKLSDAPDDARSLTLAMVDIDQFKAVNDGYSHQVGDQVLKCVATLLTNCVREGDLAARLAGDEFVVLLGDADRLDAAEVVSRIHEAVASFKWGSLAPGLNISLSIGLSQAVVGDTVESIMHRSDTSMYTEKARARWVPTMI